MGLFNALSNWSNSRYQKKVSKAKADGVCPDCGGRGIEIMPYEHFFDSSFQCAGCNGSGLYDDWEK
ncbi:methionine aminopeptidase [Aquibacillus albus]|uniref:DnaJ-class molecular chaperone n=1 Tax=Aquibacillus albus TaxID=1168171 RepID=A0ABS2MWV2_9BACI|nr:methionine aminopeptidase [Aquibacillus albus]MBM7570342.1 DnaJ-class molecular chaperone [Aquibacillus albus]